jgi:outer membrane immunogenic protein
MKKILGGFALSVLLAAPAMAADLPVRAPARAIPVAVPAVFSWTGCYIGAHIGYAWGKKRVDFTPNVLGLDFDHDFDGLIAGGQLGCNLWQADRFVFGIEGQASWADIKGEVGPFAGITAQTVNGFRTKIDVIGSIAGRLGYAIGPSGLTLLYVKGGAAFAHEKYFTFATSPGFEQESDGHLRWGWMVGGGVEHAFNSNWSIKAEYNFSHFGNKDVDLCNPAGVCQIYEIKQHVHLVKVGVNYRFGGWDRPAAVVTTRY